MKVALILRPRSTKMIVEEFSTKDRPLLIDLWDAENDITVQLSRAAAKRLRDKLTEVLK